MPTIAYLGTPDFAGSLLEKLVTIADVPFVVTQPDKPAGRRQILTPSPVKTTAEHVHIPIYTSLKDVSEDQWKRLDFALVFAYGALIPKSLLDLPHYGFWNIHPSLLPLYRNVAPIAYPLMLGDSKTGTTLIKLDEKLDHGPIIAQQNVAIETHEYRTDLETKLTDTSFTLLKEVLKTLPNLQLAEQAHTKATYTRMLKKEDGLIAFDILKKMVHNESLSDAEFPQILREYWIKYHYPPYESSALLLYNLFRGLSPWPGLWTQVFIQGEQKRLKLLDIKYNEGKILLKMVQLEGKKPVDFATFQKAYQVFF